MEKVEKSVFPHGNEYGGAIIVGMMLAAVVLLGISTISIFEARALRPQLRLAQKFDALQIKREIIGAIDCNATYLSNGLTRGSLTSTDCASTSSNQVAPFLRLHRATKFGPIPVVSANEEEDGSYRFNNVFLRASCSVTEESLIVKVGIPDKDQVVDWTKTDSLLVGSGNYQCEPNP